MKESESLYQPVGTIFGNWLEKAIFGFFGLVVVLLLSPLTLRSIIVDVVVLLVSIWLSTKLIKAKRSRSIALRFWAVIVVMFLFAAICPFIVAPKPVYIAVLASNNPLKSKIRFLESGGKTIGSIILVLDKDLIRQSITPILRKIFPDSFRVLEKTEHGKDSFYSLPVFKGFIFNLGEPGEFPPKKNVYFPSVFVGQGIELDMVKPEKLNLEINKTLNNFKFYFFWGTQPLIDFAYIQYPDTIPWDAVQVQNGQDISILIYAALLDRTLEFFAAGKTEEALNGLDSATIVVPAQNLEGARLAVLKYFVTELSLIGNVGELQSLPLLHNAYDLFLQSQNDPRFSAKDPLVNWLRGMLLGGYENWSWSTMFFDRVSTLNSIPHIEDEQAKQNLYTDALKKSLKEKSYDELLKSLQSTNYSTAELHFIKYLVHEKFIKQGIYNIRANNSEPIIVLANIGEEAKKAIPLIQFIDSSLARKHELQSDPYSVRMLDFIDFLQKEVPTLSTNTSDTDVEKHLLSKAKRYPVLRDYVNLMVMFGDKTNSTNIILKGTHSPWWKTESLIWFTDWSLNAVFEIDKHDHPWIGSNAHPIKGYNVRGDILKHGTDYFTRDMGGNGRTFLPSLFFLTWYAQTFNLDASQELKQQFEAEAKIPFDMYLSKLFPPGNSYENVPLPVN